MTCDNNSSLPLAPHHEYHDLIEMRKTDNFGEARLVLHIPSHHELGKVIIVIMIIITTAQSLCYKTGQHSKR